MKPCSVLPQPRKIRKTMNAYFQLLPEAVGFADVDSKAAILGEMARLFSQVYELDEELLADRLSDREALGSTGFGRGVAIPHARLDGIQRPVAALLRLERAVDFGAVDSAPVNLVFGLVSPVQSGQAHLLALAAISRLVRDERVQESLLAATSQESLYGLLANVIDRNAA